MRRLCERPGCSEVAAVAYGMRTEDLVFWLDVIVDGAPATGGVLCQRHADSMVVPRGWTLDDLRDPHLHLFRPPLRPAVSSPAARRRRPITEPSRAEQLALGGLGTNETPVAPEPAADPPPAEPLPAEPIIAAGDTGRWTPNFDAADDLNGLLAARSPLLSRAFRGAERAD